MFASPSQTSSAFLPGSFAARPITSARVCRLALILPAVLLLLLSIVAYLPCENFLLDTLAQIRIVLLCASIFAWICALALKVRRAAFIASVAILSNLLPMLQPPASAVQNKPQSSIKLLSCNVWAEHNKDACAVGDLIEKEQPDAVCLQEIDKPFVDDLKILLPDYRYIVGDIGPRGSIILSRRPLQRVQPKNRLCNNDSVLATINVDGIETLLVCEHTSSPVTMFSWCLRNAQMHRLAKELRAQNNPVIVMGDFNAAPWSHSYRQLCRAAALGDADVDAARLPTWGPSCLPPLLPLDHCLLSRDFQVVSHRIGPRIGSDHSPVIVQISVRSRQTAHLNGHVAS